MGGPGFDYYEAVPYLLVIESIERDGVCVRRAEHPELPGCAAEAPWVLETLDRLARERARCFGSPGIAARRSRPPGRRCSRPARRSPASESRAIE